MGKVIGTRTWGGEIWLRGSNVQADNGIATAAEIGVYGPEGKWLIEGHGVDPDIVVDNLPHATFSTEPTHNFRRHRSVETGDQEIRGLCRNIRPTPTSHSSTRNNGRTQNEPVTRPMKPMEQRPGTAPKASLSDYLAAERTLLAWIRTGSSR